MNSSLRLDAHALPVRAPALPPHTASHLDNNRLTSLRSRFSRNLARLDCKSGPESCKSQYITCPDEGGGPATVDGVSGTWLNTGGTQYSASTCQSFLPPTSNADLTEADFNPRGQCDSTCTQQTTGVCSAAFLSGIIAGDGVKTAWCNDKWLVIQSSGKPGTFKANLDDVPFPPGGGSSERTGMASQDESRADTMYYPLSVTDLAASAASNNIDLWDAQTYLQKTDGSASYGLPADAGIGMGVNGQSIFPIYNNVGEYTPGKVRCARTCIAAAPWHLVHLLDVWSRANLN